MEPARRRRSSPAQSDVPAREPAAERAPGGPGRLAHLLSGPLATTRDGVTRTDPALAGHPLLADVLAHESVHVTQFRAWQDGAPAAGTAELEREAAAGGSERRAGAPFVARLGAPAGLELHYDPPDAISGADPVAGPQTPQPITLDVGALRIRAVKVPGEAEPRLLSEGGPVEPQILADLLRAAIGAATFVGWLSQDESQSTNLSIAEVLRLGDRASWVRAREIFEANGANLLASLRDVMSDRELGAVLPYLRGVVPVEQLIRVWEGVFSSDVEGVVRTLDRMPDQEVLGLIQDYRTTGRLAGTSADTLAGTVERIMRAADDGGYRALRALAGRVQKVTAVASHDIPPADLDAARELASQLRVRAAFARIREGDRHGRPELAYLAVGELGPIERYLLQSQYLPSWTPTHLSTQEQRILYKYVASNEEVGVLVRGVQESRRLAESTGKAENTVSLQAASEALGSALSRLAARARDPSLPQSERDVAAFQLTSLAADDAVIDRLLELPGGRRLVTQGLGLSPAQLARHLVLRATSSDELVDALRGLHPVDIGWILDLPDVRDRLTAKKLQVTPAMHRVLSAQATLAGSRPEPLVILDMSGSPPSAGPFAGGATSAPGLVTPSPSPPSTPGGPDPLVVAAGYQIYRSADSGDLAGVVAAVRPLRGSQRAQLQDEDYFTAALGVLRSSRWDDTPRVIADIIADPAADLSRATSALVAAGLLGAPGDAFQVRDPRMLAEGLSVDPADRRLLRYYYVIRALEEEQRQAGVSNVLDQQFALRMRGVPAELSIGSDLEKAYGDRMFAIDRLPQVPRLAAEDAFLGEPELMRADMSPEEAALEAEFMRVRLGRQLAAAGTGIDASGVFGFSPETLTELTAEFDRTWQRLGADGHWTQEDLVQLAAAYYDALDAVQRNRRERDKVAEFVGTLAAVVAAAVTIAATGGAAAISVSTFLASSALGAGADAIVASQFRDYTSPDQAFGDLAHGAVSAALTVAGEALAFKAVGLLGREAVRDVALGAVNRAGVWFARTAIEGAINGAVFGAGDAVFATIIDRSTWERGVMAVFARFVTAALQGAFTGAVTGAVASPIIGGAFAGAGKVLVGAGRRLGVLGPDLAAGLERVGGYADQGRLDMALRHLDELTGLTGAQREAIALQLYRQALATGAEGAAIPEQVVRELERARQVTRGLDYEVGPVRPGERPRLNTQPVEDLLSRLKGALGPGELAQLRKVIFAEIRLAPEELIVKQQVFRRGLDEAVAELVPSAERAALPPYEVRVLPPEAFEGMFRNRRAMALTLVEGDRAVVYVRADADVRTYMLQEAAHVQQLGDPALAAQMRLLGERNMLAWAGKSPVEQMQLLTVQRRLEVDAQQRIIDALTPELPYAADATAMSDELAAAHARLRELQVHEQQAATITSDQLAEMEAGRAARPDWMNEEARLYGLKTDGDDLTIHQDKVPGGTTGASREPNISDALGRAGVERHVQEILGQLRQLQATGRYTGEIPWRVTEVPKSQLSAVQDQLDIVLTKGDPAQTRAFVERLGPAGAREVRMPVGRGTRSGLAGSRKVDHLFPDPSTSDGVVFRESKNLWESQFSVARGSHSGRELLDDFALLRHRGFAKAVLEWRVDSVRPLPHDAVLELQTIVQAELGDTLALPQFQVDAAGNILDPVVTLQSANGRFRFDFRTRTTPF